MSNKPQKLITIAPMTSLFLVFLILQLTHVIEWSWWWVTAPLWGPFVLCFSLMAIFIPLWIIFMLIVEILDNLL